jgi:hypothetical protein
MDGFVRFSDYDIFGYLSCGLVALGIWDASFGSHLVLGVEWTITHGAVTIIAAYVAGHANAAAATLILDRIVVRGTCGTPATILMSRRSSKKRGVNWRKWLLSGFLEPLSSEVQERVRLRSGLHNPSGEDVFWKAWPIVKRDPVPYGRVDAFLRLYGFCRNFSFVMLAAAVLFFFFPPTIEGQLINRYQASAGAFLVSLVMFHRYLKFFRAYSAEVLSTYAEPGPKES